MSGRRAVTRETSTLEANGFTFAADLAGPPAGDLVLLLHGFRYAP